MMKVLCTKCNCETNHKALREESRLFQNDEEYIMARGTWQIVQCNGCETITFREVWTNNEDFDENGPIEDITIYPPRQKDMHPIKPFYEVPLSIRSIYRESIDAFNNGLLVLCSGGLRAVIEGICNHEKIVGGPVEIEKKGVKTIVRKKDLQGKISGLFEKSLLTKDHAEILHAHRFLGNDALHQLDMPRKSELKIAIEIIEHTLEILYELKVKAKNLEYQRQSRKSKK